MLTYANPTPDQNYHAAIQRVLDEGVDKMDRTGTGTRSVFGHAMRFDLRPTGPGFPIITTKEYGHRWSMREMLWFLSGSESILPLLEQGISIWTAWPLKRFMLMKDQYGKTDEWSRYLGKNGRVMTDTPEYVELRQDFERKLLAGTIDAKWAELGPVYGSQWRRWTGLHNYQIDQIAQLAETLKTNPDDRRMIVSAWNVADIDTMAISGLPPCHYSFQVLTRELSPEERRARGLADWLSFGFERSYDTKTGLITRGSETMTPIGSNLFIASLATKVPTRELSLQMNIRSNDAFLGAPFNITQYAFLTCLIAHHVGMAPGDLFYVATDFHLYSNHLEQAQEQLSRPVGTSPRFRIVGPVRDDLADYRMEDFQISEFDRGSRIEASVAV